MLTKYGQMNGRLLSLLATVGVVFGSFVWVGMAVAQPVVPARVDVIQEKRLVEVENLADPNIIWVSPDNALSEDIQLGDMDGDGDLDMAVANVSGPNQVFRNVGDGRYEGPIIIDNGNTESYQIAWGDIDGDGDLDLVATSTNSRNILYRNLGDGVFGAAEDLYTLNEDNRALAVGDMDGDGDLDVVVGAWNGSYTLVYLNNGLGGFSSYATVSSSVINVQDIALGDLDNDGDLDIVLATEGGDASYVWSNDGNARFGLLWQIAGTQNTGGVALGDADGDGDLDIALAHFSANLPTVYENEGTGRFANILWSGGGADMATSVVWADMDRDGDLDLVLGSDMGISGDGMENRIYYNDGTGTNYVAALFGDKDFTRGVAVGDINGDKELDVVVANSNEINKAYRGVNDNFGFELSPLGLGANYVTDLAWGDIDNDGDMDLATASNFGQPNQIYMNLGDYGWGMPITVGQALSQTGALALGDVNGDGYLDIAYGTGGSFDSENEVYLNDTMGGWLPAARLGDEAVDTRSLALGDVDGDEDLDVVVGNYGAWNHLYRNAGDGTFSPAIELGRVVSNTEAVALGDVDGDGDLDVVIGNDGGGNEVYLNNGTGDFSLGWESVEKFSTRGIALGDVNGDGILDLAVGNFNQANQLYLGDGTGAFEWVWTTLNAQRTTDIELADMNGDGRLDLVAVNTGIGMQAELDEIYLNRDGMLVTEPYDLGFGQTWALAVGDWEGDGDLDVAVAENNFSMLRLALNRFGDEGGRANDVAGLGFELPGDMADADYLARPEIISSQFITIPYVVADRNGSSWPALSFQYSLDGGDNWRTAVGAWAPNYGQSMVVDSFDPTPNNQLWATSVGGSTVNNVCGSRSGNAWTFSGTGERVATTEPLDVRDGGSWVFFIRVGDGIGACDLVEAGKEIVLEYSVNGVDWVVMQQMGPDVTTGLMNRVAVPIVAEAQTAATQFRWRQLSNGGGNNDVWALDVVSLQDDLLIGDKFDASVVAPSIWARVDGGSVGTTPCGSNGGTALNFSGANNNGNGRQAVTHDLDIKGWDTLYFDVRIGRNVGSGTCDSPDTAAEAVEVEYSIDKGKNWASYVILDSTVFTDFTTIAVPISAGLQQETIRFRWRQAGFTGPGFDEWAIDNVQFGKRDRFDGGFNREWWYSLVGSSFTTGLCGGVTGTGLNFGAAGERYAETRPLNVSQGGDIKFMLRVGDSGNPASCETVDPSDYIELQYSLNNGVAWTTISSYGAGAYTAFTPVTVAVPAEARTPHTKFRWRQVLNSGANFDVWALDDVSLPVVRARMERERHEFVWDTFASGFFGQSDNVVLRLVGETAVTEANTQPQQQLHSGHGDYLYGSVGVSGDPIRVRGTQVRVFREPNSFIHYSNSGNIVGDTTFIDHPLLNNNKDGFAIVTPNWNPLGVGGTFSNYPIGLRYDEGRGQWGIFNQTGGTIGGAYNVFIPTSGWRNLTHVARPDNMEDTYTYLDNWRLNGNPEAMILVTLNASAEGSDGTLNPRALGVWYNATRQQWGIFNETGGAIPEGTGFNVFIQPVNEEDFVHTANVDNTTSQWTAIDHPLLNNNPRAVVVITQNWNPLGVVNPHHVGVWYNNSIQKWAIFNQDTQAMAAGASFNVYIVNRDVTEPLAPAERAEVFRLPAGQLNGAARMWNPRTGEPWWTDYNGYLQGRGQINPGDRLVAAVPIVATEMYTVYHTSAAPTDLGLDGHLVTTPGVQNLTISATWPLILFNLDVSLEWDARQDGLYLDELAANFERASEILYDATNGQAALGRVTVLQAKEGWAEADVVIYAANNIRPAASVGGVVITPTNDMISATAVITDAYLPGQVQMGPTWNRFGNPNTNLGDDWPRVLAHELGHFLLYLPDNYLGLDGEGNLIPTDCYGSLMTDPYPDEYSEFLTETDWVGDCLQTVAEQTTGRTDWETIRTYYPWLNTYYEPLAGPTILPLAVTEVEIREPAVADNTLAAPFFTLRNNAGQPIFVPNGQGSGYLFKLNGTATLVDDYVLALGTPVGDQMQARGAAPGDRLCIYDRSGAEMGLGCTIVGATEGNVIVESLPGWRPQLTISPVSSTTIMISMTQSVPMGTVYAQILPATGFTTTFPITSTVAELTPVSGERLTFTQEVVLPYPTVEATVRVWVEGVTPTREVMSSFVLGDGWGGKRAGWGGKRAGWGGKRAGWGAPVASGDGQVIIFNLEDVFGDTGTSALQVLTTPPPVPEWLTIVGQAYRFESSAIISRSIAFNYLQSEVPGGTTYESFLNVYYSPDDGATWQRLATTLDGGENLATAKMPVVNNGNGLYALIATVDVPPFSTGWNNFGYVIQGSEPVTAALASIAGKYTSVYHYNAWTMDWDLFDVPVGFEHPVYTNFINDLDSLTFGQGYWVHVTEPVTLFLKVPLDTPDGLVGDEVVEEMALYSLPPTTFYGPVTATASLTPTAGMVVTATIGTELCGEGVLVDWLGQLSYMMTVDANMGMGCGTTGVSVTFGIDGQTLVGSEGVWDSSQAQYHPLVAEVAACPTAAVPTAVAIGVSGSDISLTWTDMGVDRYEVWRDSEPYFVAGADCSVVAECSYVMAPSYVDVGGAGDVGTNYSYLIRSAPTCGGVSGDSERRGEFDFGLVVGQ
ncbi:MAG TPA: FG-GAP-like repeat-containing protein [Anaerolineae bacterium]|nr:FG-GAP-like repeat-containing protein [Anaerolineae bacterium]